MGWAAAAPDACGATACRQLRQRRAYWSTGGAPASYYAYPGIVVECRAGDWMAVPKAAGEGSSRCVLPTQTHRRESSKQRTLASKLLSGRVSARRRSTVVATLRRGHTTRLLAASRSSI